MSIDGPALTIRKFKKDRLRLPDLVRFGSITPEGAVLLEIIGLQLPTNCQPIMACVFIADDKIGESREPSP